MKEFITPGKAGSSYLYDASIETEAWLTAKLGEGQPVEDSLDSDLDNGWDNGVAARVAAASPRPRASRTSWCW